MFQIIKINSTLLQSLNQNNINLIGIEIFVNTKNKLYLWYYYILPHSNISQILLESMFDLLSSNSILGGDLNGHHPCWSSSRVDHQGHLILSSITAHGPCVLNNCSSTQLDRPPFPDTVADIIITSSNIPLISNWTVNDCSFCSDHYPTTTSILPTSIPPLTPTISLSHKFNFNKADGPLY